MTKFGTQKRSFNSSYFNEYSWLEYSIKKDALYCFPCRNFGTNNNEGKDTFTKTGFRNWKKVCTIDIDYDNFTFKTFSIQI